jgi:hypothetical protein
MRDSTIYVDGVKLDKISQRFLTFLAENEDRIEHIIVSDAEDAEVGTAHQINYRIREHLAPEGFVTSPGHYEQHGAARSARVWELTTRGRSLVENRGDEMARPTTVAELYELVNETVLDRLDDVESKAEDAIEKSESAKKSVAGNRVKLQRAKEAMKERVENTETIHETHHELRRDLNELPTEEDLEHLLKLVRAERGRESKQLERRIERALSRANTANERLGELEERVEENQTTLGDWTRYLAAKEEEEKKGGLFNF